MPFSELDRLPSELLIMILKHAALDGWLGPNAVCNLDILGVTSSQHPPGHDEPETTTTTTYHMHGNGFLDIFNRNGVYTVSTHGMAGARAALRDTQPLYVLLYTADYYTTRPEESSSSSGRRGLMPPAIPRSVAVLPRAALPEEAFVDMLSESFSGAADFLKVIAGVFGHRVRRIYLMHPHHRFTSTGMTIVTDRATRRKYAFRPTPRDRNDPTSSISSAILLFAPDNSENLSYEIDERDQDLLPTGFQSAALYESNTRVVTSQATGGEFAEVWRQTLSDGQRRVEALQEELFALPCEMKRLQNIVIDILITSRDGGSVLPDLESISLMTASRPIAVRPRYSRTSFRLT